MAIEFNPGNAAAYLKRGKCWGRKGELGNAIGDFKEAVRLAPGSLEASCWLRAAESARTGEAFEDRMRYYYDREMWRKQTQELLDNYRKKIPSKLDPNRDQSLPPLP